MLRSPLPKGRNPGTDEPERTERDQSGKHLAMRCDAVLHWLDKAHHRRTHPLQGLVGRTVANPSLAVRRERIGWPLKHRWFERAGSHFAFNDGCIATQNIAKNQYLRANRLFVQKCWRSRCSQCVALGIVLPMPVRRFELVAQQAFQRGQMGRDGAEEQLRSPRAMSRGEVSTSTGSTRSARSSTSPGKAPRGKRACICSNSGRYSRQVPHH